MEPREYLLSLLATAKRDDLERAQIAFANCTQEEMQQEYGQSGMTRQQILDGYVAQRKNWRDAKDFLDKLLDQE